MVIGLSTGELLGKYGSYFLPNGMLGVKRYLKLLPVYTGRLIKPVQDPD